MRAALLVAAALLLAACGGDPAPDPLPSTSGGLAVVPLSVGGVALQVEVADTEQSRSAGLRGRAGVPPGTGMVFRFPQPRDAAFTMSGVTYPLVAVFVSGGQVVDVEQMVPCAGTLAACPTYSAGTAVDTVVEAAPESLPDVRTGDPVT